MTKTILVTGATGRQGGSVVRALQGSGFQILALTRNSSSPSALKLLETNSNIKLLEGDLDHAFDIFTKAKTVTDQPIWGVFSVQAPTKDPEGKIEEKQGEALIDAAIAANVEYFIYSSIDRGGAKSSSTPTPVPHWAAKYRIEKYLEEKAKSSSMRYTVLRPTAFMEGLTNDFSGKALASMWKIMMKNDKPLQLIATKDIGWFAAQAFVYPDEFAGKYLSLAGASVTFKQANDIFKQKFGKNMPTTPHIVGHVLVMVAGEYASMFKWLKEEGTAADVDECRRLHPGLMDLGTFLEKESGFMAT